MKSETRRILITGLWASLYLAGPIILTFLVAFGIGEMLFHVNLGEAAPLILTLFMVLCAVGGWRWGEKLGQAAAISEPYRLAMAGFASYPPTVLASVFGLGGLERIFVEQGRSSLPIHILFMILFTGASLIVCMVLGVAYGVALRSGRATWRLALGGGFAGGLGFLLIVVILDLLGRRVGGPNAAATATMLTTAWAGNIVSAFAHGAASIWLIGRLSAATAQTV